MVAVSDFSGLVSTSCALASAAARFAIEALERCMANLPIEEIKADGARLRSFGPHPVPNRLPGIVGHQNPELGLGLLVFEIGLPGAGKDSGKGRPGIG